MTLNDINFSGGTDLNGVYTSASGRYSAITIDSNALDPKPHAAGRADVFLYDHSNNSMTAITQAVNGGSAVSDVADDFILFSSFDEGVLRQSGWSKEETSMQVNTGIFIYQISTQELTLISKIGDQRMSDNADGKISDNGRYIVFISNGVKEDLPTLEDSNTYSLQLYLFDWVSQELAVVSRNVANVLSDSGVSSSDDTPIDFDVANNGDVVFISVAQNLIPAEAQGGGSI